MPFAHLVAALCIFLGGLCPFEGMKNLLGWLRCGSTKASYSAATIHLQPLQIAESLFRSGEPPIDRYCNDPVYRVTT